MITRIRAKRYKCLLDVDVRLGPVNMLVGPNAAGKTTLLDVVGFVRDALNMDGDVERAVRRRARELRELLWQHNESAFEFTVEAQVPRPPTNGDGDHGPSCVKYVVSVGVDPDGAITVVDERAFAASEEQPAEGPAVQVPLFESDESPTAAAQGRELEITWEPLLRRTAGGSSEFVARRGAKWPYRTAPNRLALSAVPEDVDRFSAVIFLRDLLRDRVQSLQLNSVAMRAPCPPDAPRTFQPDGSNLPILVRRLRKDAPTRFRWWLDHLRTVLRDVMDLDAAEQPHDRHLYLEATFRDGLKVPSWLLSDGTLRLMALTLLAYLPPEGDVYVVEEPENGVHPKAVEAVVQSLSSVYEGQVFMATHSPLIVGLVEPEKLLLFSRTEDGATTIVPGTEHPRLKEWLRGAPLSELFAAGVLG